MSNDVNRQFSELAERIWEEQGIRVNSAHFYWIDIQTAGGRELNLESVDTNQKLYPQN